MNLCLYVRSDLMNEIPQHFNISHHNTYVMSLHLLLMYSVHIASFDMKLCQRNFLLLRFTCMCVHMYVCMFVCMYLRMYVCMYVCVCACMYVCMYACMYVCMCVCKFVCM